MSRFYAVMFSKPSMKKHKTWDEDGFMVTDGINFVLKVNLEHDIWCQIFS